MLSIGEYRKFAPPDLIDNLLFREALIDLADESELNRTLLLEACKADPLFWIDAFAWQHNPRMIFNEVGPFILWGNSDEGQVRVVERVIAKFIAGDSTVVPKSRYQGGTWLAIYIQDWFCLFCRDMNFVDISYNEMAVDKPGNRHSLFWKIDFLHRHLPDWMSRGAWHRAKLIQEYPTTDSGVVGYATTEQVATGGRATGIISDEHGKHGYGHDIVSVTAAVGPRLFVSAHYDSKGSFLDLCNDSNFEKIPLHWTMNPLCNKGLYHWDVEKNQIVRHDGYRFPDDYDFVREWKPIGGFAPGMRSPWYDHQCKETKDPRDIACQYDMDPTGASNLVFDAAVIARCKAQARDMEPTFIGDLMYDPILAKPIGLRSNAKGPLRLWMQLDRDEPPRLQYGIGADVARGNAGPMSTPSCFSVADEFGRKVAEYAANDIRPKEYGKYLVAIARFFHNARLCWEASGPGVEVSSSVVEAGYFNFFWKKSKEGAVWTERDSDIPGWWNTKKGEAKIQLLKDYAAALADGEFMNPSLIALDECLQFQWVGLGKAEHNNERNKDDPSEAGANHGDRVIADALCFMVIREFLRQQAKAVVKPKVDKFGGSIASLRLLCENDRMNKLRPWARR